MQIARGQKASSGLSIAAALALAGAAAGQGVTYRTLLATSGPAPRVPAPYSGFSVVATIDADHVLAKAGVDGVFLSDGTTVRRVMVPGTHIPGQPAGVVWNGSILTDAWPQAGGGAVFSAAVSGPGYTGAPVVMRGPVESPTVLVPPEGLGIPATPTGLTWAFVQGQGYVVGPVGGAGTVVIPNGYVVPGRSRSGTLGATSYLSGAGVLSVRYTSSSLADCLVARPGEIRVAGRANAVMESDRGPLSIGSVVEPASQALPDGSVYVQSAAVLVNGVNHAGLWLSPVSGPSRAVAITGDAAPGLGAGYTFAAGSAFVPLAANRAGSLLFQASLAGPGVDVNNRQAVYLWRRGGLVLIARSNATRPVGFFSAAEAAGINENDEVGLITNGGVILYRPGAGTVTPIQRGLPFPAAGPTGNVGVVYPFFGTSNQRRWSGGDDASICPIAADGRVVACININGPAGGSAVVAMRMDDARCGPDFNNDGFVDFFDYADFVECFEGGACPEGRTPDFNGDDFGDFFDYLDFVAAFEAGC